MSLLLDVGRVAAVANVALLVGLVYVWAGAYRRHQANHTLGLLIFALLLLAQNGLWIYAYLIHDQFIAWFHEGDVAYRTTVTGLCGIQTVALVVLARITWR